jgi:hypothetical protein
MRTHKVGDTPLLDTPELQNPESYSAIARNTGARTAEAVLKMIGAPILGAMGVLVGAGIVAYSVVGAGISFTKGAVQLALVPVVTARDLACHTFQVFSSNPESDNEDPASKIASCDRLPPKGLSEKADSGNRRV